MMKAILASVFLVLTLSAALPLSEAGDAAVAPHRFNAEDQKIIDALTKMSGRKSGDVIQLYKTGKGWGDVAENLGLEMEDVLKEVKRKEKQDASKTK